MIAADTSIMVAYLAGDTGKDVDLLADALSRGELVLPPAVLTELLSSASSAPELDEEIGRIATLAVTDGYWTRAGIARRNLRKRGLKAKVADALIAQACIDNDVALITRDGDFRHFARHCGLTLA